MKSFSPLPNFLGKITLLGLVLLAGWTLLTAEVKAAVDLPQMGDTSGTVISPQQERELGEAFMREVRRSLTVIDDPEIADYIQSLGYRLASHVDQLPGEFTFFVVDASSINAFAAPGGFIGVHTGLITATTDESELASVIAHEIAHVTQRHLPRAFEQASKLNLPTAAALVAAMILGKENHDVSEAVLATTLAGHQQSQINFTRHNEEEADRIGIELVARGDFDPRGMPSFFERLQQAYRFYENNLPEFLSTHPVTVSRIADSRNRAEQYPRAPDSGESNYPYVRAKLRVLTGESPDETLAFFRAQLDDKDPQTRNVARYGYALTLAKLGRAAEAREVIVPLLREDPERITYILAQAQIEKAARNHQQAERILADALTLFPGHHALTMLYAQVLIDLGKAQEAWKVLRDHMRHREDDPAVYQLYARAAGESGQTVEAHRALAEYYYLLGETGTALQQLTLAEKMLEDKDKSFYQRARVEARIAELKQEMRDSNQPIPK